MSLCIFLAVQDHEFYLSFKTLYLCMFNIYSKQTLYSPNYDHLMRPTKPKMWMSGLLSLSPTVTNFDSTLSYKSLHNRVIYCSNQIPGCSGQTPRLTCTPYLALVGLNRNWLCFPPVNQEEKEQLQELPPNF